MFNIRLVNHYKKFFICVFYYKKIILPMIEMLTQDVASMHIVDKVDHSNKLSSSSALFKV